MSEIKQVHLATEGSDQALCGAPLWTPQGDRRGILWMHTGSLPAWQADPDEIPGVELCPGCLERTTP